MGKPKSVASSPLLPNTGKERLSAGVGALLRGGNGKEETPNSDRQEAPVPGNNRKRRLVQLALVVSDILLVIAATDIFVRRNSSASSAEMVLGTACVLTGACLSCLAIWLEEA